MLCVRHFLSTLTSINSFILNNSYNAGFCKKYFRFTEKKLRYQKLSDVPKVTREDVLSQGLEPEPACPLQAAMMCAVYLRPKDSKTVDVSDLLSKSRKAS